MKHEATSRNVDELKTRIKSSVASKTLQKVGDKPEFLWDVCVVNSKK